MKYLIIGIFCVGCLNIDVMNFIATHRQNTAITNAAQTPATKSLCLELVYDMIKSTKNYQRMVDEKTWSSKKIKSQVEYSLNPRRDRALNRQKRNFYCIAFQEKEKKTIFTLTRFVFFPSSMKLHEVVSVEDKRSYSKPLIINPLILEEFQKDCGK